MRSSHQYFVHLGSARDPVPWDPSNGAQQVRRDCLYFGKVLQAMERRLRHSAPLTIYLTWDVRQLPSYGDDVVAVVLGDEWARVPAYAHRVRATFKAYGTQLHLGVNPFRYPSYLNALAAAHFVRTSAHRLPGAVRHRLRRVAAGRAARRAAPVYEIPFGYLNQLDLPIRPMADRRIDVGFSGSVVHAPSHARDLRGHIGTPKTIARTRMAREAEALRSAHADVRVHLGVTPGFHAADTADPLAYSENLMDTKICLVPRGTTWETFRFYEAMRYGCVVIGEFLPRRWYLDGSPAIQIRDWGELPAHVDALLGDPTLLEAKHRDALSWWERTCSEDAVGTYMASKLNALP